MRRLHLAVFLVSVALLGFEVALLQVLSYVQWHHFASMVISIALLGFGAAGTLISFARAPLLRHFERLVPLLLGACAIAMALAVPISQIDPVRFDSYLIFVGPGQIASLLLTYLVMTVPFLLGSLVIGLSFVRHTDDVGRLYFWNLLGSGMGAALSVVLMWWIPPATIAPLFAFGSVVGSLVASTSYRSRMRWLTSAVAVSITTILVIKPPTLEPSQFKDISRALDLPDSRAVHEQTSPLGFVQVVSSPVTRHAPGLSLQFRGELPVRDIAFVNGDAVGAVPGWSQGDSIHVLDYTTRALRYNLESDPGREERGRTLVLDAGPGEDVSHALSHDARSIVAVEPNRALIDAGRERSGSVFDRPEVNLRITEPRTYLRRSDDRIDHLILPDAGRFGGTVGLQEAEENYLMTIEALEEMWDQLDEDGLISITAWMDYPYRHPLRVMSLLSDLARRNSLDPRLHIVAVRSWTDVSFVLAKSPIEPPDVRSIRAFCRRMGFDPLLLPQIEPGERGRYNELQDSTFFAAIDALAGPNWEEFSENYDFRLQPPTDDRPYFSRFLRWRSLSSIESQFGEQTVPFFGLGLFIAVLTFLQATVLSIILIVLPLFRIHVPAGRSIVTLTYFAALGTGFMFIEIVLIQRFTLFLGHPVYAVSAVLGAILVGSGIGAHTSSRLAATIPRVRLVALVVAVLAVAYTLMLTPAFGLALGLPLIGRAIVAMCLIAPISFVLGYPFPLGLRLVSSESNSLVPWAWGVNGCLSVVGAAVAPLVSLEWGFTVLLISAAGIYSLAAIAISGLRG